MKQLILIMSAMVAIVGYSADEPVPEAEKMAKRAAARERTMRHTGGIAERKGEGKLVFINCQSLVSETEISNRVAKIAYVLKYNCVVRNGDWAFPAVRPADSTIAIFIINDPELPMSLVAAEDRWGMVNTAALKLGNRFSKELTRVFTLTAGAACSQIKTSAMQPVATPTDLDKLITDGFTIDMATAIVANLKSLGATQSKKTTYRKACEEGWAEPPKDEYQKGVWDEIHSLPAKPMTIEFNKAEGK